ncbi:calcineurin-like phosphoesterase family protein [Albidovulum inexpectatum]|uniref:Calcineurin-like phosphoesterase family protein n=1 Tax=Albidovulum inexpectatum TaxID=196587 RepID=A0A2S5JGW0_9RHOB|nr:metallophosphoesterase [Albidovulum inexpectatum]PPB80713.1 calcineurin-like phosphoesterase family protein [Albidovulum inexpectatum]
MTHIYTADLHLDHANIIRLCNRPFDSVEQMQAHYLKKLSRRVRPCDDLWVLGDFAFGSRRSQPALAAFLDRIPGRKHLVRGNHDSKWVLGLGWHSVHDLAEIHDAGRRVVLCHYPLVTWNGAHGGAVHLFGHVHGATPGWRNCVNVGVDLWDHEPVDMTQILPRAGALPPNAMLSGGARAEPA